MLSAKPVINNVREISEHKQRYGVNIDSNIRDMLLCGCGPALAKVVRISAGDVYQGEYETTGHAVKASFLKTDELADIIRSSKYRTSELVERSILAYVGYKND